MLYKLNVSIHDVTKSNLKDVQTLLELLDNLSVKKITLLLIPFYHEKESLEEIKDWLYEHLEGKEIVLHGYTHKSGKFNDFRDFLTRQEGEFAYYNDLEDRLNKAIKILKDLGLNNEGFIPPAWLINKEGLDILKKFGFSFTTNRLHILDLKNDRKIFSPVLSFGSTGILKSISINTFKLQTFLLKQLRLPVLRLALHPVDAKDKTKLKLISDFLSSEDFEYIFLKESLLL